MGHDAQSRQWCGANKAKQSLDPLGAVPTDCLFAFHFPLLLPPAMSSFRALMAISATQTKEAQGAVQQALAQRQRNEELRRKQREEQERKEQELARKLRLKHFEDEKRERERLQRLEQEKLAQATALQKREEEAKNALRYGPKKAKSLSSAPSASDGPSPKWPSSSSQSRARAEVRQRRVPGEDGDDGDNDGPVPEFLTREEKRERKQALELKKIFKSTKRPGSHTTRARKHLPGGAVDVTTTNTPDLAGASNKSVKERLAAMPNTLTKLNTVKRDTRTIDEILQDRAKAREVKVLDGDEAREFSDWFVSPKKKEKEIIKKLSPPLPQPAIPMAASGANTPASREYPFLRIPPDSSSSVYRLVHLFYRGQQGGHTYSSIFQSDEESVCPCQVVIFFVKVHIRQSHRGFVCEFEVRYLFASSSIRQRTINDQAQGPKAICCPRSYE
jgi:hypothetical protein